VYDKAAVLACRIAWSHPLPDGNKRAAWACLVLFIDLNDGSWNDEQPDTDDAVEAMLAVAHAKSTKPGSRTGCATGSPSEPEPIHRPVITDRNGSKRARFRPLVMIDGDPGARRDWASEWQGVRKTRRATPKSGSDLVFHLAARTGFEPVPPP
jgi:hypothetical protein